VYRGRVQFEYRITDTEHSMTAPLSITVHSRGAVEGRRRFNSWNGFVQASLNGLVFLHYCSHDHRSFDRAEECGEKIAEELRRSIPQKEVSA
jgi:hypothetical protein